MKILSILLLSTLILGGVGYALSTSSDLQGRFTGGGLKNKSELTSAEGKIIKSLSAKVDTLSDEFNEYADEHYWTVIELKGDTDSYADYDELESASLSAIQEFQALESKFDNFYTQYLSINESSLNTNALALFNDLEAKLAGAAYTTPNGSTSYDFEELHSTVIPAYISTLDTYSRVAAVGDLEILSIDASVGADGLLYFYLSVVNHSDDSSSTGTRPMPVGDIDLEGDYWIEGAGSSYFGMTISHDTELQPNVPTTVIGSLDIASRTSTIYAAYLEREKALYFDLAGFINISGDVEEYDRSNNAYSQTGSVL